jgi:hypothetical protein
MKRTFAILLVLHIAAASDAGNLTLPFANQGTPFWQGWIYTSGGYHGGVDYGSNCGTPIIAAADGYAIAWEQSYNPHGGGYSYGEYVLMYHPSCNCYTLYAHLQSQESFIPQRGYTSYVPGADWAWVSRGQKIGTSGATGTEECHLHFEVSTGGYASGRLDPYGVYSTAPYYPGCGSSPYYFTQCPPVPPQTTSCSNPGSYYDISKAGDFNGDRKFEFVRYYPAVGKWSVALSTGSSFAPLAQWFCGLGVGSNWQTVGDVNGDGRDDILAYYENSGDAYVSLSYGTMFGNYYKATSVSMLRGMQDKWLEDVNGDGRDDLVGYVNAGWYVATSNGLTFNPPVGALFGFGHWSTKRLLKDISGEGRADATVFYADDGSWYATGGQSNGTFGTDWAKWATWHGYGSNAQYLADIDGNRMGDAICVWNYFAPWQGYVIAWNSYGAGLGGFQPNNNPRTQGQGGYATNRLFADFTGDGRDDYAFYYSSTGWWVARSDGFGLLPASRW